MTAADPEPAIRARLAAHDLDGAVGLAIEQYGDELFGFLHGLARNPTHAEDAFAATCERIWRGLDKFRWDCPLRVWAYRIARNEFLRTTRESTLAKNTVPLSQIPSVAHAVERVRTSHKPMHERTAVRDRFEKLREQLEPDDHALLGLRIDRKMSWIEIAKVLAESEDEPTASGVAALRKRFERLKLRLRELVAAES